MTLDPRSPEDLAAYADRGASPGSGRTLALVAGAAVGILLSLLVLQWRFNRPAHVIDPTQPIVPGQSVGPIRLGMSQQEVLTTLGRPDRTEGRAWQYERPFLAVMFSADDTVNAILAGGPLIAPALLPYKTAEGIALDSTTAQVVSAYGPPAEDVADPRTPDMRTLRYPARGIDLAFVDDQLTWLSIRAAASPPATQSVP